MGIDDVRRAIDVKSVIIIVAQGYDLQLARIGDAQFPDALF